MANVGIIFSFSPAPGFVHQACQVVTLQVKRGRRARHEINSLPSSPCIYPHFTTFGVLSAPLSVCRTYLYFAGFTGLAILDGFAGLAILAGFAAFAGFCGGIVGLLSC